MNAGLHGKSGLNPHTLVILWKACLRPVLTYGLNIISLTQKVLQIAENFQIKMLKQLLGLPNNTPATAIYILTGLPPIEAVVDRDTLTMLGNIARNPATVEHELLQRHLALGSKSWFNNAKRILAKYGLASIFEILKNTPSKSSWKNTVDKAVNKYWENQIELVATTYPSLRYMSIHPIKLGSPHMAVSSVSPSVMDVRKATTKLRLITGTYSLQSNRATFNQFSNSNCIMCAQEPETRLHFLCMCPAMAQHRDICLKDLKAQVLLAIGLDIDKLTPEKRLSLILDPKEFAITEQLELGPLHSVVESSTRNYCYKMHCERRSKMETFPANTKINRKRKTK